MTTINGIELDDGVDEPNWTPTCDYCMGSGPLYRTDRDADICAECFDSDEDFEMAADPTQSDEMTSADVKS